MSVSKFMLVAVDITLWLIFLPIHGPFLLIFGSVKFILNVILQKFFPNLDLIKDNDLLVARAGMNKNTVSDIGLIFEMKVPISLTELRNCLRLKLDLKSTPVPSSHPLHRLHCNFTSFFGYLCTQTVPVDLKSQVRERTVSVPAEQFFSRWFQTPYNNPNLPRWEMVLVKRAGKGIEKIEHFVGFRIHHGLVDGQVLLSILEKLCDKNPLEYPQPKEQKSQFSYFNLVLSLPRDLIVFIWTGFLITFFKKSFPAVHKEKGKKFFLNWTSTDLEPIKRVRRRENVPFSTILYTAQSEAVRTYLEGRVSSSLVPELVPAVHTIPKHEPRAPGSPGNHWTLVKLYANLREPDIFRNLQSTAESYSNFVDKGLHISGPVIITKFLNLLPTKWCLYDVPSPLSTFNLALSNTLRQAGPEMLCGKETKAIHHVFLTKDLCSDAVLYTTTASVGDKLYCTHAGCSTLFPAQKDLEEFTKLHWHNALRRITVGDSHAHRK